MTKTALVIDDSGSFRMVIKVGLERAGYRVITAANGQQACDHLDGQPIDLIISDLNMPEMDGLEFVRHLRTTPYQFTPVVMLTTESQEAKRTQGMHLGIRIWVTKPFQPATLFDAVQKVCPI